jgi:hypothetical protein
VLVGAGLSDFNASFRWVATMRVPSTRIIALVVLALVVLLTIAEFGPAVLSGK